MKIAPVSKRAYRKFMGREMKGFFMDFFGPRVGAEYCKIFSAKERAYFLSARESGRIAGAVKLGIRGRIANVGAFAVAKGRRGSGIGTELMEKCEQIAKRNKCRKIWLWTMRTMDAYKFYKSMGYKEEAVLKKQWGGRDSMSVMSKFL